MGLNDVKLLAEREKELIKLKDNYEETMAKMKERRTLVENNIQRLRDEAGST
jgi:prefoldin subunit 5